jgi:hypothetical protein
MMAKPLEKMSLEALQTMRADVVAHTGEGGPMTLGQYTDKFGKTNTLRAEHAAVLAQLDDAIAKHLATGSEKIQ